MPVCGLSDATKSTMFAASLRTGRRTATEADKSRPLRGIRIDWAFIKVSKNIANVKKRETFNILIIYGRPSQRAKKYGASAKV